MGSPKELVMRLGKNLESILKESSFISPIMKIMDYQAKLYALRDFELDNEMMEEGNKLLKRISEKDAQLPRSWHNDLYLMTKNAFNL